MNLKYRARRENKKENNQNRKVIWFNPPYNMQVSTNIAKCFFNLLDQNFVNNIDYTRSLIEIMLRLVTHAQKICRFISFHNKKLFNSRTGKPSSKTWSTFFLVESTKIENASFPYKTSVSEANAKTNRMVSTQ